MTKHVCSSTFTHKGRQVTVTLVDPEIAPDGTRYPLSPSCSWRSVEPNGMLPVPTDGVMVPATFRVTGLEHDLTVTTRHGRWDDAPEYHGVQIDTVTVHWTADSEQADRFTIPTRQLRTHLGRAAWVRGIWIPPGGEWHDGPNVTWTVGPDDHHGDFIPTGFGYPTKGQQAHDAYLAGLVGLPRKPRSTAETMQAEIEQVAEIWHATPNRQRAAEIAAQLHLSATTTRNRIRQARDQGLIPEATDGRSRQNRRQK